MRLAILGAGSVGFSSAVLAAQRGHEPTLWSPSGARTALLREGRKLVATGVTEASISPRIADTCADAVAGADVVMIAVTCEGTRPVIDMVAPHLAATQTVVLSSHSSLSALYLSSLLAARDVAAPIMALGTTIAYSRQTSLDAVHLWYLRDWIDCAAVPADVGPAAMTRCQELFGERFFMRENVLTAAMCNVNAIAHMGMLLGNFTRMEQAESWHPFRYATPACARLIVALDRERLAVAAALGATLPDFADFLHHTYHVPVMPIAEQFQAMYQQGDEMVGPADAETRWLTQDIPYLAATLELIARIAGVPVPIHAAALTMFATLYGRDLRLNNDILPRLGIDRMELPELLEFARVGHIKQHARI
jgi:opine dehydrogenase